MRIIQLIDSLNTGGAEKIAVSLANSLNDKIDFSGIVATRQEGNLYHLIENKDNYLFLNKKKSTDLNAIFKLLKFCKYHKVEIVHAHTTSFFTASLLKLFCFKIKIIYHEHTGFRSLQTIFDNKLIWCCSFLFYGIIVVNQDLEKWYKTKLNFKKILYLPNFVSNKKNDFKTTKLNGFDGKRILSLANLKNPKNHNLLIEVAKKVINQNQDWSFHLIGTDFFDDYSENLKKSIKSNNLEQNVFIYGLKNDINNIINQSEICVITSDSEGLPVAFLEYGLNKKAVVVTNVGEISNIIRTNKNGILVPTNNADLFSEALIMLINNHELRLNFGEQLFQTISNDYSEKIVVKKYLNWLN